MYTPLYNTWGSTGLSCSRLYHTLQLKTEELHGHCSPFTFFNMALDAKDMPLVAAQHNSPRPAMECSSARTVICFLVSLLGVWCKPKLEQCAKLRQCPVKGDTIQSVTMGKQDTEDSTVNQNGLCAKSGQEGSSVWPKSNKGKRISQEFSYGDLMEGACRCRYDMKSNWRNNGGTITSSDRRTSGAGLNLHFFMAILLSTNKLTPEKT